MIDLLRTPGLFIFCLLAMSPTATCSIRGSRSLADDIATGLTLALWSFVIAALFPSFFLDAQIGTRYLLIAHTNSALLWASLLVLTFVLLPPLPVSILSSASLAALIASPDLLGLDLLIGGLIRLHDPQSGLLLLLLPITLLLRRIGRITDDFIPFVPHTLFLGLIPAFILRLRADRHRLSLPAAISGSLGYLFTLQFFQDSIAGLRFPIASLTATAAFVLFATACERQTSSPRNSPSSDAKTLIIDPASR